MGAGERQSIRLVERAAPSRRSAGQVRAWACPGWGCTEYHACIDRRASQRRSAHRHKSRPGTGGVERDTFERNPARPCGVRSERIPGGQCHARTRSCGPACAATAVASCAADQKSARHRRGPPRGAASDGLDREPGRFAPGAGSIAGRRCTVAGESAANGSQGHWPDNFDQRASKGLRSRRQGGARIGAVV